MAPTSGITLRTLTVDDAPALGELMRQAKVYSGTLQMPYRPDAYRREWIEKSFSDQLSTVIVAEVDGVLAGMAGLHAKSKPRQRHVGGIGMSVREELQGQGVGTALMHELMRVADDWYGLVRVELEVYTDNEPALALYRGCGFEIEGTLRAYALRAGEYVDAYVMSRIRPAATRPTLPLK